MAQSATDLLLYRTNEERWKRGEVYADQDKVNILEYNDKQVKAIVAWSTLYNVELAFIGWWLSKICTCPIKGICKHIVATAILWDESRWIPRPTKKEVSQLSLPSKTISRNDVKNAYTNPLSCNLDIIRIMAEEYCLGTPRPHAVLPKQPKLSKSNLKIELEEIKFYIQEMRSRSRKYNYDMYFCSGEMVAAFCEMIRKINMRIKKNTKEEAKIIYQYLKKLESEIIYTLIDDSQWLHKFTETHLTQLENTIKTIK